MSVTPAAQYVRMSTEHQQYSPEYQMAVNAAYAAEHGLEIVQTFADYGVSGLTFRKRDGLKALLAAVLAGSPGFSLVLVYDVSRWGRFQDPDEAAHYEFLCRSAGVAVRYTAEPFQDDGSLASALVKQLKRAMAAEFSRELSKRVSRTQLGLAAKGYWMGGPPPFGLRRLMMTAAGEVRGELGHGELSAIRSDRIVLTPGPPHEVRIVRRIFRMFVRDRLSVQQIANRLVDERVPAREKPMWTSTRVRNLLRNPVYQGDIVLGKRRHNLGTSVRQPRSEWVRAPGAFKPLVSRARFAAAQDLIRTPKPRLSDEALLRRLREVLKRHGRLSRRIIDEDPRTHCASVYRERFGALSAAYARIGYEMSAQQAATSRAAYRDRPHLRGPGRPRTVSDETILLRVGETLVRHGRLSKELVKQTPGIPASYALSRRFGGLEGLYRAVGYEPDEVQLRGMRNGRARSYPTFDDW